MATMNPIFNEYMKDQKLSENTVRAYRRNINEFLNFVNKADEDIKTPDVRAWVRSLEGLSTSSIAQRIASVRTYFAVLVEYDVLDYNPANKEKIKAPHVVNKEKHHMTSGQIHDMIEACDDIEGKAMISLMASSGMRVSEVCGIEFDDYVAMRMSGEHHIYIYGKGNKRRAVIFNEQSCELIDNYLKGREDHGSGCNKLFLSSWGNKVSRNILSSKLKTVAKKAGVTWSEDMCPHQLRAATATILSDKGVPVSQIRDILGHADVATTNRYIRRSEQNVQANVMSMSF